MEYTENRYNLADISTISDSSTCTVREQVSLLGMDLKGCLHSTFNYPLHSTINFVDLTMNLSESTGSSKTLVDSDNTLVKLNENLRASDIKDSTMMSREASSVQSKRNKSGEKSVLLPDQTYPAQSSLCNNNDLTLLDDEDSDCDSSCLSIDVDGDLSLCVDDEPVLPTLPQNNNLKTCYVNHMIRHQVRAQMWGEDYSQSSSLSGDCDVCKLMRMKRQRACTDLWTGPRSPFEDPSTFMTSLAANSVNSTKTTLSSTSSTYNKRRRSSNETTPAKRPHLSQPSRKPHPSIQPSTPCVSLRKRVKRPSKTPSKPHIYKELGSQDNLCKSELGERLHPEGSEDNKENVHQTLTSVWSSSSLNSSKNDSGFSSTNNSIKSRSDSDHFINNLNISSHRSHTNTYHDNIPEQRNIRRKSRKSLRTSPFCDSIPTPSPWKGDKKLLKKKLKELSLNVHSQTNIQTLGCF